MTAAMDKIWETPDMDEYTKDRALLADIQQELSLRVTLATMRSAKEKGIGMNIWEQDIKAVEDALATLEAIRNLKQIK